MELRLKNIDGEGQFTFGFPAKPSPLAAENIRLKGILREWQGLIRELRSRIKKLKDEIFRLSEENEFLRDGLK